MAVTAYWYAKGLLALANKEADLNEATKIKVMLTTSTYTPNQDTHDYKDDVTNEVTGTGYTAGGAVVATLSLTTTLNVLTLDGADTTWGTSTITARRAVCYYTTGTDGTSPLLFWIDFGEDKASSGGDFTIQWAAGGLATITATDATGYPA
jgi:hypothetical protein